MARLAEMRRERARIVEQIRSLKSEYVTLAKRADGDAENSGSEAPEEDRTKLDQLLDSIGQHEETLRDHDARIERVENALQFEADNAEPAEEEERRHQPGGRRAAARARKPDHETEPSLVSAACRARTMRC